MFTKTDVSFHIQKTSFAFSVIVAMFQRLAWQLHFRLWRTCMNNLGLACSGMHRPWLEVGATGGKEAEREREIDPQTATIFDYYRLMSLLSLLMYCWLVPYILYMYMYMYLSENLPRSTSRLRHWLFLYEDTVFPDGRVWRCEISHDSPERMAKGSRGRDQAFSFRWPASTSQWNEKITHTHGCHKWYIVSR